MTSHSWVRHLSFSNIKKHMKRNIFSIIALTVGLTSSFLVIGFSTHAEISIKEECYHQFDYGNITITKEKKTESTNGGLSIVRSTRPSKEEMMNLRDELDDYEIEINTSSLVPNYLKSSYGKDELKDYTFEPIYSFFDDYTDKSLLIEGEIPYKDDLEFVLVNDRASNDFLKKYKTSIIGKSISLYHETNFTFYTGDENNPAIIDYYTFDKQVIVVGIVKELSFLSTPKIYYSYIGLLDELNSVYLNNLSNYYKRNVSWIERISECNESDPVSAYTYRLFLKKFYNKDNIELLQSYIGEPFYVECSAITRNNALLSLVKASSTGMELFLIIALIGTSLIMGIVSFSFYLEDRKVIAILSCLGADTKSVNGIYCLENLFIGLIAFILSIALSPLLELLINYLVKTFTGFINIVSIPFSSFFNVPFGLPIIVLLGTILISIISTLLPIAFAKKISLKEELKDE